MMRKGLAGQRLVAVFFAGILLFDFPLLSLFDLPLRVWGVPLLHFYVFVVWAALILVIAWIAERGAR